MYKCIFIIALLGFSGYVHSQIKEEHIMLRTKDCDIQGTLMLPDGDVDAVVLIVSGEGPTDRDGNQKMMRNNSYKQYAISLGAHHIASVRYDKRGIAASRMPDFDASEMRLSHYVDDVKAWVQMLRNDDRFSKIVVAGHSEGALMGLAAMAEGCGADGFISIAGIGRTYDIILKEQLAEQPLQIRNIAYQIIDTLRRGKIVSDVPVFLRAMFTDENQPYLISTFSYNPVRLARQITVPVLIVQGDTDMLVKVDDARLLFTAAPKSRLAIIDNMNHIMKYCPTLDKNIQADTYVNPSYPLSKRLVEQSVQFINAL